VPLIAPAIATGTRYLFVVSMTAISATIFLVSVRWSLLTVRILECITEFLFAPGSGPFRGTGTYSRTSHVGHKVSF